MDKKSTHRYNYMSSTHIYKWINCKYLELWRFNCLNFFIYFSYKCLNMWKCEGIQLEFDSECNL